MPGTLFAIGISWRTAPVAVREQLAFRDEEIAPALGELRAGGRVSEAVLISTCNRVELYGVGAGTQADLIAEVRGFLARSRGAPEGLFATSLFAHTGDAAVRHVFQVAAALDSLVLGEAQILGQLKQAFATAAGCGAVGPLLGRCLERAFGAAKRVRSETAIARGGANVSSVAVDLAIRVFGDLRGKSVLVIGAGKMSTLAARHLRDAGVDEIVVTNRSPDKAERLADEIDGVARPFERLDDLLAAADVVITSTGARQPILTKPRMKKVAKARRWRPLVIVDIAVPRDAEPAVGDVEGVYLFDIDALEKMVAQNLAERAKAAEAAARIVEAEAAQFDQWLLSQRVVPTIRALRDQFTRVAQAEAQKLIDQLRRKELTADQRDEAIRRLGTLIVNKLLHAPQTALKEAGPGEAERLVEAVARLHRVDPTSYAIEPPAAEPPKAGERPALAPVAAEGGKRGS